MNELRNWLRHERPERSLSLTLQGGGAFGAVTWGVLDRLLDHPEIPMDTISGTSAGAVNAVLLADGLAQGGRQAAKEKLGRFWHRLGDQTRRLLSPWIDGWDAHPLRRLLEEEVDFERLRAQRPLRLIVNATRVRDGQPRLFREDEVTLDVVLASACLPNLTPPVEIDGEFYWDGGYSANPPLQPLALTTRAKDILLVQILPEDHGDVPRTPLDIATRTNIIAFNAGLQRELTALADLTALARETRFFKSPRARRLSQLRLHRLCASDYVENLHRENPLSLDPRFLARLHQAGVTAADEFLGNYLSSSGAAITASAVCHSKNAKDGL